VDLDHLIEQALVRRPDLAAARNRLTAAEQSLRIASGSRWPQVSLSMGYNSRYTSSSEAEFFDQLDERRGGSVGLNFTLPVLDRSASAIARQRGRIQVENAQIALDNTRQAVAMEVRTAYLDLEYAEEQARQAEAQLRAAQLALEASQERYNIGAATLVELSQARAAQLRAASDLVNARYGLVFQSRLIDYYLGAELLPES
jgi:outer membrane protein